MLLELPDDIIWVILEYENINNIYNCFKYMSINKRIRKIICDKLEYIDGMMNETKLLPLELIHPLTTLKVITYPLFYEGYMKILSNLPICIIHCMDESNLEYILNFCIYDHQIIINGIKIIITSDMYTVNSYNETDIPARIMKVISKKYLCLNHKLKINNINCFGILHNDDRLFSSYTITQLKNSNIPLLYFDLSYYEKSILSSIKTFKNKMDDYKYILTGYIDIKYILNTIIETRFINKYVAHYITIKYLKNYQFITDEECNISNFKFIAYDEYLYNQKLLLFLLLTN